MRGSGRDVPARSRPYAQPFPNVLVHGGLCAVNARTDGADISLGMDRAGAETGLGLAVRTVPTVSPQR